MRKEPHLFLLGQNRGRSTAIIATNPQTRKARHTSRVVLAEVLEAHVLVPLDLPDHIRDAYPACSRA